MSTVKTLFFAAASTLALVSAAQAHPKLLSSTPGSATTAVAPNAITLKFSEKIVPRFTGLELIMTSMPGMAAGQTMKIGGFKPAFAKDGKTLTAQMAKPLTVGGYRVAWHAVAADTHRINGSFDFAVK